MNGSLDCPTILNQLVPVRHKAIVCTTYVAIFVSVISNLYVTTRLFNKKKSINLDQMYLIQGLMFLFESCAHLFDLLTAETFYFKLSVPWSLPGIIYSLFNPIPHTLWILSLAHNTMIIRNLSVNSEILINKIQPFDRFVFKTKHSIIAGVVVFACSIANIIISLHNTYLEPCTFKLSSTLVDEGGITEFYRYNIKMNHNLMYSLLPLCLLSGIFTLVLIRSLWSGLGVLRKFRSKVEFFHFMISFCGLTTLVLVASITAAWFPLLMLFYKDMRVLRRLKTLITESYTLVVPMIFLLTLTLFEKASWVRRTSKTNPAKI